MFTVDERQRVRETLLSRACADDDVVGAAVTGSASSGASDRWSDIDLFFGVTGDVASAVERWSDFVYAELAAVHHFDLVAGEAIYRAFLRPDGLEIDLGFAPAGSFGPVGSGGFDVVFGDPAARRSSAPPSVDHIVGLGWHHVLHGRTSIERGKPWEAEYWISALRDHALTLACLRLNLPSHYHKGADRLPADVLRRAEGALVPSLDPAALRTALAAATDAFLAELPPGIHARLAPVLTRPAGPVPPCSAATPPQQPNP
jgi:hypothetical protein